MATLTRRAKNEKQLTAVKEITGTYKNIFVFEMCPVRTRTLHDMREVLRDTSKIVFGKKSVLKKGLSSHKEEFLNSLTANTFLVFTNEQSTEIIEKLKNFNVEKTECLVPSGLLKINNVAAPTVIKKDLLKFGLNVTEKNGHLFLEEEKTLDEESDAKLIKMLKLNTSHMNIVPKYVFENGKYKKMN